MSDNHPQQFIITIYPINGIFGTFGPLKPTSAKGPLLVHSVPACQFIKPPLTITEFTIAMHCVECDNKCISVWQKLGLSHFNLYAIGSKFVTISTMSATHNSRFSKTFEKGKLKEVQDDLI